MSNFVDSIICTAVLLIFAAGYALSEILSYRGADPAPPESPVSAGAWQWSTQAPPVPSPVPPKLERGGNAHQRRLQRRKFQRQCRRDKLTAA